MNCPKCGNPIAPNAQFCSNCGAILTNNTIETLDSDTTNNSPESNPQQVNGMYQQPQPQPTYNNNTNINLSTNQPSQNITPSIKIKKFNPLFVIVPLVAVVVVGTVCYFTIFNKSNSSETNNVNNNASSSNKVLGWDDYSLFIDGNEIKLPMKFSDFAAMGFYEMDTNSDSILTKTLNANSRYGETYNSNVSNIFGLFTNGKTSNINLVIYNNSNEVKQLKDCYITRIGFEVTERNEAYFTIGNVKIVNNTRKSEATIGKTKYGDIESAFGPHYEYDYANVLTYYPDSNSDGIIDLGDLNFNRTLHMYFDSSTRIFDAYEFYLYDTGNFEE